MGPKVESRDWTPQSRAIRAISVQTGITPVEELVELRPDVMLKDLRELRLKALAALLPGPLDSEQPGSRLRPPEAIR